MGHLVRTSYIQHVPERLHLSSHNNVTLLKNNICTLLVNFQQSPYQDSQQYPAGPWRAQRRRHPCSRGGGTCRPTGSR